MAVEQREQVESVAGERARFLADPSQFPDPYPMFGRT
jgi:hypothetical protein